MISVIDLFTSWITEAGRCSALSLPQRCHQRDKPPSLTSAPQALGTHSPTVARPPWQSVAMPDAIVAASWEHLCSWEWEKEGDIESAWMVWAVARSWSYRGEHSRAFSACHGQVLWSVRTGSQAGRQASAGTFGICSYQQERSALQSLQGEGGERERGRGLVGKNGEAVRCVEMEEKLENWPVMVR